MRLPWHNFHFIGIGGIGMSGLASLLLEAGYKVSGSDLKANALIERLKAKGGRVYLGHRAEQVNGAEVVVYSSAVKPDNPELEMARKKRLPILSRGELLALLMEEKKGIAIAGTHGKTTTSAMVACILEKAGLSPTVVVGGCINNTGTNAWWGKGEFLVAEADESDGSFLKLHPYIAVVTNIEADHLDYYQNLEAVVNAFSHFLRNLRSEGCAVIWGDDKRLRLLAKGLNIPHLSFGLTPGQDIEAKHLSLNGTENQFELYVQGKKVCSVNLPFPGRHNVLNALAALTVATTLDIDLKIATAALKEFKDLAEQKDSRGQYGMGLMYDLGTGVSTNFEESVKWYKLSAEQGNADAQNNLATMYAEGEGVEKDAHKAEKLYERAAQQGNFDAPNNLGTMYLQGAGITRNYIRAYMWFHLGEMKGDRAAKKNRAFVETKMNSEEIIEANKQVEEWMRRYLDF